jgi:aspartate-semialdehyde dehydrogenase
MNTGKLRLALIGAESLRGREIKNLLSTRPFPLASFDFFDPDVQEEFSSLTEFQDEPKVIAPLTPESLDGMDLVFLAGDNKTNRRYGRLAGQKGFMALDLGEAFVEDRDVPVVVSGINDRAVLKNGPSIVANPHPVSIVLCHLLNVLRQESRIRRAVAMALQPASAFDDAGIEELASQSLGMLQSAAVKKKVFRAQAAFNLLSQTSPVDEDGFSAGERQIPREVRAVLSDPKLSLSLSLVQAPVFHAYSLMVYLELADDLDMPFIGSILKKSPFFKFSAPSLTSPVSSVAVAGQDRIFVGQLKKDTSRRGTYWLWAAADNLTRGSALNAYEIARSLAAI